MKKIPAYFPGVSIIAFLLLLTLVSILYGYNKTIWYNPCSIHQWRQTDCYSFAVNYYQEGMEFFKPSLHFIGRSETGKTSAEFPVIYYIVAAFWKVFGQKAIIFRLINILIVFSGLAALFKLTERLIKDTTWALMLTILLFTSPILIFYTNNFLSDAPAFGLSLVGLYFFYLFFYNRKNKHLYIACFFFLMGALLKVTAAMFFVSIVSVFVLERIPFFKFGEKGKLFHEPSRQVVPLLLVFAGVYAWYSYSAWYNKIHNGDYFLLGISPLWKMKYSDIITISRALNENLIYQYFNIYTFIIVLCMFAWLLIMWKKNNLFFVTVSAMLFIGCSGYLVLFYNVFDVHDYYLINLLIFMAFVPLAFMKYVKDNHPRILGNTRIKMAFLLLLCFNIYYAHHKNRIKYQQKQEVWHYSFLNRSDEVEYWRWFHWYYKDNTRAYETVTPYLRLLGIERTDRVISISDQSPNISLALMDVKGVTDYGGKIETAERVIHEINRGAQYLIVNKRELVEADFLKDFTISKMGSYQNIEIFDLRSFHSVNK